MKAVKRFKVVWTNTARADLEAFVEYLASDSIDTALHILDKLEQAAIKLTTMPMRGRVVPELAAFGNLSYRELIVSVWRIVYRISGEEVFVLAVLDGHRNMEDLLLERFIR